MSSEVAVKRGELAMSLVSRAGSQGLRRQLEVFSWALAAGTGFQAVGTAKTNCRDALESADVVICDVWLLKKYSSVGVKTCIMNSSPLIVNLFFW